jgi:hypothetical protein
MEVSSTSRVGSLLEQQIDLFGAEAVSLDSLWRAAGSPTDESPREWLAQAVPLIAGFLRYQTSVPGRPIKANNVTDLVWSWHGENSEPWRTGDLLAHELLARVYAAYLESAWPSRRGEL